MGGAKERLLQRLDGLYVRAERLSGGWLSLLHRTWLAFVQDDGPTMARSIAYYALFSVFPLLLAIIALSSSILASEEAQNAILDLVEQYLPVAIPLVEQNIKQVLGSRGTIGVLALAGLLWSASGVFRVIYHAVNRAWGNEKPGPVWAQRFYALTMIVAIGFLLLVTPFFSAVLSFVRGWQVPILGWHPFADPVVGRLLGWLSALVPTLLSVAIFALVYRTMPRAPVSWRDVWPGGVAAGLIWEAAKQLFAWYLSSFARYNLVYGSVGAIIAFLLWSYLSAQILLLGAEFTAEYSRWRRNGHRIESRPPRQWRKEWSK
jgi:membrane protein